ncbi:hypothetical protein B0H14DRAFT_3577094 [Mycena olivaceomarginata]|nr:hypothetical protein B0H14DRAFT_3577094 [Mycena olivaceomarginata]
MYPLPTASPAPPSSDRSDFLQRSIRPALAQSSLHASWIPMTHPFFTKTPARRCHRCVDAQFRRALSEVRLSDDDYIIGTKEFKVRPFHTSASLYNSISTGLPHLPHHRTSLAPHPSRPYRGRTISARPSPGSFPARRTLRSQSGTIAGVSFDTSIECLTPHACGCRLGSPNLPLTYRPLREGAALNLTPRWTEPEPAITDEPSKVTAQARAALDPFLVSNITSKSVYFECAHLSSDLRHPERTPRTLVPFLSKAPARVRLFGAEVGTCDQASCDFNSYRMGATSFYRPGLTVHTNQDHRRPSNGRVIPHSNGTIPGVTGNVISNSFCAAQKSAFGDTNTFASKGRMATTSRAASAGMILVMSIWNFKDAHQLRLPPYSSLAADASGLPLPPLHIRPRPPRPRPPWPSPRLPNTCALRPIIPAYWCAPSVTPQTPSTVRCLRPHRRSLLPRLRLLSAPPQDALLPHVRCPRHRHAFSTSTRRVFCPCVVPPSLADLALLQLTLTVDEDSAAAGHSSRLYPHVFCLHPIHLAALRVPVRIIIAVPPSLATSLRLAHAALLRYT